MDIRFKAYDPLRPPHGRKVKEVRQAWRGITGPDERKREKRLLWRRRQLQILRR